ADKQEPGRSKLRELEYRLSKGLLAFLPELDHWAMEEFFWHGLPGDYWHPIEAFLEHAGARFPPAAQEQLRRWKEARIGLYEIGDVANDTVGLREYDPVRQVFVGPAFRAITLNIGGVNVQREHPGKFLLTHVAPWRPEECIWCGLGYGQAVPLDMTTLSAA